MITPGIITLAEIDECLEQMREALSMWRKTGTTGDVLPQDALELIDELLDMRLEMMPAKRPLL
jgi:hypothetical protein